MNSRTYITAFTSRDTSPAEEGPERDQQIVRLARRILPSGMLENVTDAQVLRLHRDFMRGLF